MRHANKILLAVLAAIACVVVLYAAAYLAILDLGYTAISAPRSQPGRITMVMIKTARYRVGGNAAATFFAPAQKLDAAIRPDAWENAKWSH